MTVVGQEARALPVGFDPMADSPAAPFVAAVSSGVDSEAAHSRRQLVGATAVIGVGNVLSRGLGLVREQAIAATFGATAGTDAFVVARSVSTILYDLLIGNVITAAFVPVFVQSAGTDRRQLWRVVGAVFSLAALALALVAAVLALFAEPFVAALVSDFPPDRQRLSADLLRVALVSVVLQGLAGMLMSALYALNRFVLPAFAVAVYNTGVIFGVLALSQVAGVYALVIGLVIGAAGQLVLQSVGLREFWAAYRPRVDFADPAVRKVLALYVPVAAGMLVTVAGYAIDRNLASRLAAGSLSAMQYATTVIQFPLGIVGIAASYAVLPTLARYGGGLAADPARYRETLLFGMKLDLLLMLPALAGLAALAYPLITLLFQRGQFGAADTDLTARVFLAYLPQLPFTALDQLLIVAFYARQDVRTPVLVGVASVAVYLAVAISTINSLGAVGLALADASKNTAHALILLVLMRRALPDLRLASGLGGFLLRTLPAATAMGALVWLAWNAGLASLPLLAGLTLALALGGGVYVVLLQVLGVQEVRAVFALVRARVR